MNCGKASGSKSYTRSVTTYRCGTCGATATYYPAANSGTCAICKGTHTAAASGSTTVTHKAVPQYKVCDR